MLLQFTGENQTFCGIALASLHHMLENQNHHAANFMLKIFLDTFERFNIQLAFFL